MARETIVPVEGREQSPTCSLIGDRGVGESPLLQQHSARGDKLRPVGVIADAEASSKDGLRIVGVGKPKAGPHPFVVVGRYAGKAVPARSYPIEGKRSQPATCPRIGHRRIKGGNTIVLL